jgi:N-methylhydantoinase A
MGGGPLRPAWFGSALVDTPVLRRETLRVGGEVNGPLLIEEDASTTVLPPGWRLGVLPTGHLDLRRDP